MPSISKTIFSPWFTEEELGKIEDHTEENFIFIQYSYTSPTSGLTYNGRFGRLNTKTQQVMFEDPRGMISFKCGLILIGNLLELIGRIVYQILKTLYRLFHNPTDGLNILGEAITEIARTIWYCLGIELAALSGLCYDPLQSRERIELLAKKLNHGVLKQGSYQEQRSLTKLTSFYLAICFQPFVEKGDQLVDGKPIVRVVGDGDKDAPLSGKKDDFLCWNKWVICCPLIPFCNSN